MLYRLAPIAALLLAFTACGGDDDDPAADGGPGAPDAPAGQADAATCDDPTAALPNDWRPIDSVSAGAVSSMDVNGTNELLVDATAGGFGNSADEPYVYVDLTTGAGAKVDITDVASYSSSNWDIALKRYVIRVNGGDSGPGGVEVAAVAGTSLDGVTQEPAAGSFITDEWASDACVLDAVPTIGGPLTAFGIWYETGGMLNPLDFVHVVRLRDDTLIKLRIDTYYGDPNGMGVSAYYRLLWEPL
jgi:hypothetical protein